MSGVGSTLAAISTGSLFSIAVVVVIGYALLSLIDRRIGGRGGGSEAARVAAWFLIAALVLGLYLAG